MLFAGTAVLESLFADLEISNLTHIRISSQFVTVSKALILESKKHNDNQ